MDLLLSTLLSPMVLFFALGLSAALLKSQMTIPEAFAKGLAVYLMMAIGLKGGVEIARSEISLHVWSVFAAGILLSFVLPLLAFTALRLTSKLERIDAAATAAHYGSISIVTFVAATQVIYATGLQTSGFMVAVAALMEAPAIMTALLLAQCGQQKPPSVAGSESGELYREVLLNASVVVLVGALAIGWISGESGMERIAPFFVDPFQGVLCLFLLDMGLSAGRGLRQGWRQLDFSALVFGLYMPLISAAIACGIAWVLGMPTADMALLMVLAASASYIAVPAAMLPSIAEGQAVNLSYAVSWRNLPVQSGGRYPALPFNRETYSRLRMT